MPEGDTVYKLAAALKPELEGERVVALILRGAAPGRSVPQHIVSVEARGKHLLFRFDDGRVLRSHLGLHGDWHRYAKDEPWRRPARQAMIRLETEHALYVCFNAREWEWLRDDGIAERNLQARLRHDLLAEDLDLDGVIDRARELLEPDAPMVDVLLDQRVAAGIGNVYKSEILFIEGVDPMLPLAAADDTLLQRLYRTARQLLQRNVGGGPRTTRESHDGSGRLWVYGRRGRSCYRCGTLVRSAKRGRHLRSTYWCPRCQARAAAHD